MESSKDTRRFTRYKKDSTFMVSIGGNSFKAQLSNFSIGGLGFSIEVTPITPGSIINLKIEDLNLDIQGKVAWSKRFGSVINVGIEKMTISGNLKYFPLSDVLLDLQRSEKTGILEIKTDPICKKIYIKNGDMIFADSNQPEDHLAENLLKTGRINLDQYRRSVDIMGKMGNSDGKAFVQLGYLKPKELIWRVMHQVEEIILSLFQWEDAEFRFIESTLPSGEITALRLSAANLIYQGVKKIDKFTHIKNGCPSMDAIMDYSADPMNLFQDIKIDEKEREILFLIDGKRTMEKIISLSPLDNFKTMQTLYGLLSARIIEVKEDGSPEDTIYKEALKKPEVEVEPAFVGKVEDLYSRLKAINYYDLLGIRRQATLDEVKGAYYQKTREFHPDKHFCLPSETMKNKLNAIFSTLSKAYETLSDLEKRGKYDKGIPSMTTPVKSSNSGMARERFQEGKEALLKGAYTKAADLFRKAIHLDSSVAAYHFCLALALKKEENFWEAKDSINKALMLEPSNTRYITELGYIHLDLGFNSKAKETFEKVLRIDPSNKKAAEGLKKIGSYYKT